MLYEMILTRNNRCTIAIAADGKTAYFPGIDYSNGSRPIVVVSQMRDLVVVKIPGGKHFSGRGSQSSHPATYNIFALLEEQPGSPGARWFWAMELVEFPVRSSHKTEVCDGLVLESR